MRDDYFKSIRVSKISTSNQVSTQRHNKKTRQFVYYPKPIVDEKKTAKVAKEKVSAVRKLGSTKRKAEQVYIKHGSRSSRNGTSNSNMDGVKPKALSSSVKRVKLDAAAESGQSRIDEMLRRPRSNQDISKRRSSLNYSTRSTDVSNGSSKNGIALKVFNQSMKSGGIINNARYQGTITIMNTSVVEDDQQVQITEPDNVIELNDGSDVRGTTKISLTARPISISVRKDGCPWSCAACTFLNEKPLALSCLICGTMRY